MAVALVQNTKLVGGSGNNGAAQFFNPVTPGNLVVVSMLYISGAPTPTSVTDDKGNIYTQGDYIYDGASLAVKTYYLLNCPNNPLNISDDGQAWGVHVEEYSGVTALDAHVGNYQASPTTATDNITSGAITTTANGDLIWGSTWGTNSVNVVAGTGFSRSTAWTYCCLENRVQATAGSIAATFTFTTGSGATFTSVIAFKVSGGGGGSTVDLAGSLVV